MMVTAQTPRATARQQTASWKWLAGYGVFSLLLSVAALFLPELEWAPRSGLVGWLLFLGGAAEFASGGRQEFHVTGRTAKIAGLITALAGVIFITRPFAEYFSVATVVTAWLLVRGTFVLTESLRLGKSRADGWLAVSGAVDFILGLILIVGISVTSLVVSLFGPTPEVVARFSLILAISFLVIGVAQLAMAMVQRSRSEFRRDH